MIIDVSRYREQNKKQDYFLSFSYYGQKKRDKCLLKVLIENESRFLNNLYKFDKLKKELEALYIKKFRPLNGFLDEFNSHAGGWSL